MNDAPPSGLQRFYRLEYGHRRGRSRQETCASFVDQALAQLSSNCGDLTRNSACYGYNNVTATFFEPFTPDAFTQPNDRV